MNLVSESETQTNGLKHPSPQTRSIFYQPHDIRTVMFYVCTQGCRPYPFWLNRLITPCLFTTSHMVFRQADIESVL